MIFAIHFFFLVISYNSKPFSHFSTLKATTSGIPVRTRKNTGKIRTTVEIQVFMDNESTAGLLESRILQSQLIFGTVFKNKKMKLNPKIVHKVHQLCFGSQNPWKSFCFSDLVRVNKNVPFEWQKCHPRTRCLCTCLFLLPTKKFRFR